MFLGTFKIKMDKAGRVMIPKKLSKSLSGASDLVFVGCGAYMELWTQKDWAKEQAKIRKTLKEVS